MSEENTETEKTKSRRGFASMSPERQKEIASLGGKAAHAKGSAHEFTREEAREAGRKGGKACAAQRDMAALGRAGGKALSAKRGQEYMSEIGKKGGCARPHGFKADPKAVVPSESEEV